MARLGLALLLALACAASVQGLDVAAALRSSGATGAAALLEAAELTGPLGASSSTKWTALVPTDAAVNAFLKNMSLTVDDLKARPGLAKKIAAQHLIVGHNVRDVELFEVGPARIVASAAGRGNELLFVKGKDGKVTVTASQGVVANVNPKYIKVDEEKTVHLIDAVLFSDQYYTSWASLCTQRPTIQDFCKALTYAGLAGAVDAPGFSHTVFVPNDKAFTGAINLAAPGKNIPSPSKVADVLKYHVLAGPAREVGRGFKGLKAGQPTLLGGGNNVQMKFVKAEGKNKQAITKAYVVPSDGVWVPISTPNVYVGQSIAQGIQKVLLPGQKPATSGRRLLSFGWGFDAGQEAAEDATTSAITAAASGRISTAQAADETTLASEELSVPGDYNQVDNGVNPW